MSDCVMRMLRSFDLMRVVAFVMGGCLCTVMIVLEQMLDVAIRSCQQPEHGAARCNDPETDVNLWLP